MKSLPLILLFTALLLLIPGFSLAFQSQKMGPDFVTFNRGEKKRPRVFESAQNCQERPCVVSRDGVIRLSPRAQKEYNLDLGLVNKNGYASIALYQAASALDAKLSERLFYRRQNRRIFNLEQSLNDAKLDVIYIYGIDLH